MWVRSQDRKTLVDSKRIVIMEDIKIINLIKYGSSDYEDYDSLGTYKTKGRTMEVLKKIQDYFNEGNQSFIHVFEMPQE